MIKTTDRLHGTHVDELGHRAERLTTKIWDTDNLTSTLTRWLRCGKIHYVLQHQHNCVLDADDATSLRMATGEPAVRRTGLLQIGQDKSALIVATVTALVAHHRLEPDERIALDAGNVPLGEILGRDMKRHTQTVDRAHGEDLVGGQQVLRVAAKATRYGTMLALLTETVYARPLMHRVPGELPRRWRPLG